MHVLICQLSKLIRTFLPLSTHLHTKNKLLYSIVKEKEKEKEKGRDLGELSPQFQLWTFYSKDHIPSLRLDLVPLFPHQLESLWICLLDRFTVSHNTQTRSSWLVSTPHLPSLTLITKSLISPDTLWENPPTSSKVVTRVLSIRQFPGHLSFSLGLSRQACLPSVRRG